MVTVDSVLLLQMVAVKTFLFTFEVLKMEDKL